MKIVVFALVEPNQNIIDYLEKEYHSYNIEIIRRKDIDISIPQFVKMKKRKGIGGFFIICDDLKKSEQLPYFMILGLVSGANTIKILDLKGVKQDFSWKLLLFNALPRVFIELLFSSFVLILSWLILTLLDKNIVYGLTKKKLSKAIINARSTVRKTIAFFWLEFSGGYLDFKTGGEISHIVGFVNGLSRLGYRTLMVSSSPIVHKHFTIHNDVIDDSRLPQWPGEIKQMAYNWKVLFKSRHLILKGNPFLIYHRITAFAFLGVLLSIYYRIPLIIEINSSESWKAENWHQVRFKRLLKKSENICIKYASRVAVVSDEVRDYFIRNGVPSDKIIVNPNGVDPDFFLPKNIDRKDNRFIRNVDLSGKIIVGYTGSFKQYHGILTLARSIKLVIEKVKNIHFLIIGDGTLRQDFEKIIRSDEVADFVTLTGKVSHEFIPNLLDFCDVLVSPHQNMEDGSTFFGSPTKLFEYMAMGKGIVASNVGQLGQILEHEVNAILVRPEDPGDLANGIVRMSKNKLLREKLGEEAKKNVLTTFTWEKNAERILNSIPVMEIS